MAKHWVMQASLLSLLSALLHFVIYGNVGGREKMNSYHGNPSRTRYIEYRHCLAREHFSPWERERHFA